MRSRESLRAPAHRGLDQALHRQPAQFLDAWRRGRAPRQAWRSSPSRYGTPAWPDRNRHRSVEVDLARRAPLARRLGEEIEQRDLVASRPPRHEEAAAARRRKHRLGDEGHEQAGERRRRRRCRRLAEFPRRRRRSAHDPRRPRLCPCSCAWLKAKRAMRQERRAASLAVRLSRDPISGYILGRRPATHYGNKN